MQIYNAVDDVRVDGVVIMNRNALIYDLLIHTSLLSRKARERKGKKSA